MQIKSKPKMPIRRINIKDSLGDVDFDGIDLAGLENHIRNNVTTKNAHYFKMMGRTINDYKKLYLEEKYSYADSFKTIEVYGTRDETDMEFANRMEEYEKHIVTWEKWHTENEQAINDELQRREDQLKAELEEKQAKEIAQLEKQLKKLKGTQ